MGVKSAQELRRMNKSQAFHKETIPKHVFGSWSKWQVWASGAVGKYGQLEQLGAAKRGVLYQPKGRTKLHSINRELHVHSRGRVRYTFSLHPLLSYTHSDSPQREKRAWSCPGNFLATIT
ncbi:unnamed protein product [Prunus armeniaca]